eukprot:CAMPEP_0168558918 /NCGR_PEP_ID=MMETSP0413-20121227/10236_1 /TAXON_ID=136452 /ORGANISM="Filamoeba nolandi, Strain NC-AS-23-1" /LENGTH=311 /DNA_ID=CAMNT_0008590091 /DNA_START=105 /DNA_END=1040 /DNA_ORIENTATION=+
MNDTDSVYTKPSTTELIQHDESPLFYIKKFLLYIRDYYRSPKNILKTFIICAILGGLSGAVYYLADTGQFEDLMKWVVKHKFDYGLLVIFGGFMFSTTPVMLVFMLFGICCGYIYGWPIGFGISFGMCMIGAIVSYLPYRYWGRAWLEKKFEKEPVLRHIDEMIEQNGLKFMLLVRVAPLPFGVINAITAPARVNFGVYVIGAAVGVGFEQAIYNYVGTAVKTIEEAISGESSFNPAQISLITIQCVLACVFLVFSFFVGKKAYDKVKSEEAQYEEDEEKRSSKLSSSEDVSAVETISDSPGRTPPRQSVL